jgi:hypothetical protein
MQALRDVYVVLEFLLKAKQPGGDVQVALARLRASLITESESAAETLTKLQARRAFLKPQKITLADRAQRLRAIVPKLPAKATPTQLQKAHQARLRADQAAAELSSCTKELAAVETALAQHTKQAAAA